MKKEDLLADIAKKHKELTGVEMTNSSFLTPTEGKDQSFTVTWNHNVPKNVMLYVYYAKAFLACGPNGTMNNPVTFLDSQDGSNGCKTTIIPVTAENGFSVELENYSNLAMPASGFNSVGVSW